MTESILLVLLQGAYFERNDFAEHGFLDSFAAHIEIVVADVPAERYLDGDVTASILDAIIAPARSRGIRRIWLLGISLGATGALLTFQAQPDAIEGLILLAPFLGTRGLIAEVTAAGGLATWNPGPIAPADRERSMLARLKIAPPQRLHLGYGASDRFASTSRMLAEHLPNARVTVLDGAHDWPTWERLWSHIQRGNPFDAGSMDGPPDGAQTTCAE